MGQKNMLVSITVGLKDKASAGLQQLSASVKRHTTALSNHFKSTEGGFVGMLRGWAAGLQRFESRLHPWVQRIRKLLLGAFVPGVAKFFMAPLTDLVGAIEKKLIAAKYKLAGKILGGGGGGSPGAGADGQGGAGADRAGRSWRMPNIGGMLLAPLRFAVNLMAGLLRGLLAVGAVVFKGIAAIAKTAWNTITTAARGAFHVLTSLFQRLVTTAKWAAAGIVAAGVMIAKSSLDAASEMEGFYARLKVAMKSPAAATEMLNWAKEFAKTTPFELGEVVDATTRLELYVLSAKKWLPLIGDMAGAMGRRMTDAVEAAADLFSGGGLERIKEFGINSQKLVQFGAAEGGQPGQLDYSTADALQKNKDALEAIIRTQFGGGMAQMMQTAAGATSNFKDAIYQLRVTIGQALMPVYRQAVEWGMRVLDWMKQMQIGERVGAWLAKAAQGLLNFVAAVVNSVTIRKGLTDLLAGVVELGRRIFQVFFGDIAAMGKGNPLETFVQNMAGWVWWLLDNVLTVDNLTRIKVFFLGVFKAAHEWLSKVVAYLAANMKLIGEWLNYFVDMGKWAVQWTKLNWDNIVKVIVNGINSALQAIAGFGDGFVSFLEDVEGKLRELVGIIAPLPVKIAMLAEGDKWREKYRKPHDWLKNAEVPGGGDVNWSSPAMPMPTAPTGTFAAPPAGLGPISYSPTYNVDARGATDPEAIRQVVKEQAEASRAEMERMFRGMMGKNRLAPG